MAPPVFKSPSARHNRYLRVRWLAISQTILLPTLPWITWMKAEVGTQWTVRFDSEVGASSVQDHQGAVNLGSSGRSGLEIQCCSYL